MDGIFELIAELLKLAGNIVDFVFPTASSAIMTTDKPWNVQCYWNERPTVGPKGQDDVLALVSLCIPAHTCSVCLLGSTEHMAIGDRSLPGN